MQTPARSAVVLRHVAFEDLGSLEVTLQEQGFSIEIVEVATAHFPLLQAQSCDLLVVLGGPIGVYDRGDYPFLDDEVSCLAKRLESRRPTLGICLGAQLMAAALGARVYAGQNGAEIGWSPIQAATNQTDSAQPVWFAPLLARGINLLHWHGDTFDLPANAVHLARTKLYENQSFAVDNFALGLQFHPEVTEDGLESWYIGHACELHHAGISVAHLRHEAQKYAPALQIAAAQFWKLWLDSLF